MPEWHSAQRPQPETNGTARVYVEKLHVNAIDAAAGGASDGMMLAINVAAMLIAFLAVRPLAHLLDHRPPSVLGLSVAITAVPVIAAVDAFDKWRHRPVAS